MGRKKHKQNQENFLSKMFKSWEAGDYPGLWYEAVLMKQSRKIVNETKEALEACAKALCLRGQFGRAAKILSFDGVAPDKIQTCRELKILHTMEEEPGLQFQNYSYKAHQLVVPTVFGQTEPFPYYSAASLSKINPENFSH